MVAASLPSHLPAEEAPERTGNIAAYNEGGGEWMESGRPRGQSVWAGNKWPPGSVSPCNGQGSVAPLMRAIPMAHVAPTPAPSLAELWRGWATLLQMSIVGRLTYRRRVSENAAAICYIGAASLFFAR